MVLAVFTGVRRRRGSSSQADDMSSVLVMKGGTQMVKSPHPVMSIEPFPGGRLVRHLKGGQPHITIQVSGDVLAAALRQLDPESPEPHRARRSQRDADNRRLIGVRGAISR